MTFLESFHKLVICCFPYRIETSPMSARTSYFDPFYSLTFFHTFFHFFAPSRCVFVLLFISLFRWDDNKIRITLNKSLNFYIPWWIHRSTHWLEVNSTFQLSRTVFQYQKINFEYMNVTSELTDSRFYSFNCILLHFWCFHIFISLKKKISCACTKCVAIICKHDIWTSINE